MSTTPTASGRCECGAVQFETHGPLRKVVYCHCKQCQRTSGHYVAATACATGDLKMIEDSGLGWYVSSDIADRGFCRTCGSSLFYRPNHGEHVSIMAGTLERPTGLTAKNHIFVAEASDYHVIGDGLPQYRGDVPRDELWADDS